MKDPADKLPKNIKDLTDKDLIKKYYFHLHSEYSVPNECMCRYLQQEINGRFEDYANKVNSLEIPDSSSSSNSSNNSHGPLPDDMVNVINETFKRSVQNKEPVISLSAIRKKIEEIEEFQTHNSKFGDDWESGYNHGVRECTEHNINLLQDLHPSLKEKGETK